MAHHTLLSISWVRLLPRRLDAHNSAGRADQLSPSDSLSVLLGRGEDPAHPVRTPVDLALGVERVRLLLVLLISRRSINLLVQLVELFEVFV